MISIAETPRLVLRQMTEADAANLLALNTPNVMRFIPGEPPVRTLEESLAVLRERVFPQYALGLGRWACIEKESGHFVGWCGVKRMPNGENDIGYRFLEPHWGKGFATEAARATCELARQKLRGERVVGKAMLANVASRRVLEKIGLTYEGDAEEEGHAFAVYVLAW